LWNKIDLYDYVKY